MGRGAGAAAGAAAGVAGAAGVEVSAGVVGEVCATQVAVAPVTTDAVKAPNRTRLSCKVLFMMGTVSPPKQAYLNTGRSCPRSDCTLLPADEGVQLIVFF